MRKLPSLLKTQNPLLWTCTERYSDVDNLRHNNNNNNNKIIITSMMMLMIMITVIASTTP